MRHSVLARRIITDNGNEIMKKSLTYMYLQAHDLDFTCTKDAQNAASLIRYILPLCQISFDCMPSFLNYIDLHPCEDP